MTSVFIHGHQPNALLLATISSIPKDNQGDICSDANYRGIALSSCIGKVLDKLILWRNSKELTTSNLQFAYKEKHGTSMCTIILKEVIKYYLDRQSEVYSCFIDASKAFDKIHHDKLFELLIRRGVSAVDLRVLLDLYTRQKVRTVWQGEYSEQFTATNGIRQGSISSPILFCCYMDELIHRLQLKGTGCWIGHHFYGSVAYADDLTLLSPTAAGLQSLISVCEDYGKSYGMSYNPTKSHCVLFTRKKLAAPILTCNGEILKWEKHAKHLGNLISCDLSEKLDVKAKRSDLVGRVNLLAGYLYQLSNKVIMKMFASQCCHYYGTQTWQFSASTLGKFSTMWNRCVRRLLKLPNRTHCRFLPYLAEMTSPTDQICRSFLRLFNVMKKSENEHVRFLANRGANDARSIIGGNLQYVCKLYKCSKDSVKVTYTHCTDCDLGLIQAIKDLLNLSTIFTNCEQFQFLSFLCIN